jgi:hypothetical protein
MICTVQIHLFALHNLPSLIFEEEMQVQTTFSSHSFFSSFYLLFITGFKDAKIQPSFPDHKE